MGVMHKIRIVIFITTVLVIARLDKNCVEAARPRLSSSAIVCKPTASLKSEYKDDEAFFEWAEVVLAKNENITPYITHILHTRLEEVVSGRRQKIFTKHYKKLADSIDGKYTKIISTHGRSESDEGTDRSGPVVNVENPGCAFQDDISSLDLSFTPSTYALASKEIIERVKSESADDHDIYSKEILFLPKLVMRAMKLGLNFAPVTMTCGLAALSKSFREKIWFNIVGQCLAKSGPAFIKWGKSHVLVL